MHIPDGFIAPQVYVPAYAVASGLWGWSLRGVRRILREETIPQLAVLTALSFAVMMIMIPLPGGTSVHATGVAVLALLFGVRTTFLATSLVLALQAFVFGAGGVTALPVNALAIGLVGALVARGSFRLLRGIHETAALVVAGWLSINASALIVALVLGAEPLIAHDASGHPLFFPFGFSVTLPAVMIPHAVVGLGEGALTMALWRIARARGWNAP